MTPDGARPPGAAIRAVAISALFIAALVAGAPGTIEPAHAIRPSNLLSGFARTPAIIETSQNVCLLLHLYLADTSEQHARGLMYVEQMDEFEGMLFRHPRSVGITMWMKNTYIPLDMLFIREVGSIAGLEKQTTPLSTQRIVSPEPVAAVLELNGGFADRWHVLPGNRLLAIN
jgi:uncharacterized membrane protein (UPF0127 family)